MDGTAKEHRKKLLLVLFILLTLLLTLLILIWQALAWYLSPVFDPETNLSITIIEPSALSR